MGRLPPHPHVKPDFEYHGHPRFYVILEEIAKLHSNKNWDYAGDDGDPLGNFKRVAEVMAPFLSGTIPPNQLPAVVALFYMMKQVDAVNDMVSHGRSQGKAEGVIDKLTDIAVYAILTRIMIEESMKVE